jgi:oxepin-CoA hydrolase/3-oxo-5,6-dehydrosuberyl-CoA semialdehyde dehydrogenase
MQQLASFLSGTWQSGRGRERTIHHAISGEALWSVTSEGLDMAAARRYAIERGGEALHAMTFIERAAMLKAVAKHLLSEKETFYALSAQTGATKADSWVDIEGGIGTLFTYASLGSRELPDDTVWPEDEPIPLSKEGGFAARHVLTSKSGVAVHINAFNFPAGECWKNWPDLACRHARHHQTRYRHRAGDAGDGEIHRRQRAGAGRRHQPDLRRRGICSTSSTARTW